MNALYSSIPPPRLHPHPIMGGHHTTNFPLYSSVHLFLLLAQSHQYANMLFFSQSRKKKTEPFLGYASPTSYHSSLFSFIVEIFTRIFPLFLFPPIYFGSFLFNLLSTIHKSLKNSTTNFHMSYSQTFVSILLFYYLSIHIHIHKHTHTLFFLSFESGWRHCAAYH